VGQKYVGVDTDYLRTEMVKTETRRAQGEQNVPGAVPTESATA